MRVIPVRETAFAGFSVVMEPEAKVANRETGEVRKDQATGQTVYVVGLVAIRGRDSSVIQVSTVGEPKGLTVGMAVRVTELDAVPWDRDGRSGVTYRASSVVPLEPGPAGRRAFAALTPPSTGSTPGGDAN